MALRHLLRPAGRNEANDVRAHQAVGGLRDAEIAIFRVSAQPALEVLLPVLADDEALRGRAALLRIRALLPVLRAADRFAAVRGDVRRAEAFALILAMRSSRVRGMLAAERVEAQSSPGKPLFSSPR